MENPIMLSETEYCDQDEGIWYENDLQLAAELGKTLLERNRDLEVQLRQSQQNQLEQTREIDLLKKQLDVLRNVNESRMRIYEEVDRNLQELEKTNERFRQESKVERERTKSLSNTLESLEARCEELQKQVERMALDTSKRRKQEKRTWSVPSLTDMSDDTRIGEGGSSYDYLGFPAVFDQVQNRVDQKEMKELRDTVRHLKFQLSLEQKKRKERDEENSLITQENAELGEKVKTLEEDRLKIKELQNQLYEVESKTGKALCRTCNRRSSLSSELHSDHRDLIEEDNTDEIKHGEVVRLKNGGSAYGSRESLNLIGLEPDDMTPTVENCRAILLASIEATPEVGQSPSKENKNSVAGANTSMSLLGEMEEQYRKLVHRYEALIEAKTHRNPAQDMATSTDETNLDSSIKRPTELSLGANPTKICKADTQTQASSKRTQLDLRSPMDPIEGHFENGPPEYKKLFKEIFETLRRSVVYEDETQTDVTLLQQEKEKKQSPQKS